jgi:NitT/TauT family transport system substrate-binding protein
MPEGTPTNASHAKGRGGLVRERCPCAVWFALAAAAALTAIGCSRWSQPERLTVGIVELPATGLIHVARHYRHFEAEGVDVRVVAFPTGREALDALLDGRVDAATTFETPLVARALAGDRPRILTTLHQSARNTRVVAPRGSGIDGPEDLRGRRVGVPRGTNAEYFLETLVALAGLDPLELREVDVRPQDLAELLKSGRLDAVAVWYPWVICGHPPLEALECVELFADGYTEFSLLVSRDDVIGPRLEALRRFLRALSRAEQLILERPDAALPALEAVLPDRGGVHLAEAWRRVTPQLGLDHLLLAILAREAGWVESRMDAPTPTVEFRTLLFPDLLLEIDPSTVTLLSAR